MIKQIYTRWIYIARPNKKYFCIALFTSIAKNIIIFLEPMAFASVINYASMAKTELAILWLFINLFLIVGQKTIDEINYSNYIPLTAPIFLSLNEKLSSAIIWGKKNLVKTFSPDLVTYVADNDIPNIADFADEITIFIGNIIYSLLILAYIFIYSYIAGLFLIGVIFINYVVSKILAIKKEQTNKRVFNAKLKLSEKMSNTVLNKKQIKSLNIQSSTAYELNSLADNYIKEFSSRVTENSLKDNWISLLWKILATTLIIFFINALANATISLVLFLILIPYINTFIEKTGNVFEFIFKISSIGVCTSRFSAILIATKFDKNGYKK